MIAKKNEPRRKREKRDDTLEPIEGAPIEEEAVSPPGITIEVCINMLVESHTLLRNIIARFGEGMTEMELAAITNGIECIELVLSDERMVALYQSNAMETMKKLKEKEEAKEKVVG